MQGEKIVIRGGTLVYAHGVREADIWIEGGVIRRVGKDRLVRRTNAAAVEYDASGMYVLPGFVTFAKTSFHPGLSREDYLNAMREMVRAGCTTLVDLIAPENWMDNAHVAYRQTIHYNSLIDYLWHVRLEANNLTPKEVLRWCRQGYKALHVAVRKKGEIFSRDWETISGILSSYRAILHLQIESASGMQKEEQDEIRHCWLQTTRYWKARTVVPGMFRDTDGFHSDGFGHLYWLTSEETEEGLRLLQRRRNLSCPIAANLHDVRLTEGRRWAQREELLSLCVRLASQNAAKAVGLYPRKGSLAPGADADLVFLKKENWLTKIAPSTILKFNELFHPVSVMSNGKWIYHNLGFSPVIGMGRWLRNAHPLSFVI